MHVSGLEKLVPRGTLISDAILLSSAHFSMPCGGRGTCGKCACWVSGAVSEVSEAERAALARTPAGNPPASGFSRRMACYCRVAGDCAVVLPQNDGAAVLSRAEGVLPRYDGEGVDALGIAIDIGTTTVALRLYDLARGELIASRGEMNRQGAFGADVLSRIACADRQGREVLRRAIASQLSEMALSALQSVGVPPSRVARAVAVGNTTMLHFLADLNPHGIGVSPFIPESLFGDVRSAGSLVPRLSGGDLYLPRCISAYVGADISAGILASGLTARPGSALLIDVGTNGEMALFSKGRLLCCATAAGPAFEGAQIEMGMAAAEGAIQRVRIEDGALICDTVGGVPAKGICGTGLISAVYAMRRLGALDESGALEAGDTFPLGETGVHLTARDIREVQLAKSAIAAGVITLLKEAHLSVDDVEEVMLAGGFGSVIDPVEAEGIGLIPEGLARKTRAVGNIALQGAAQMLFSLQVRREAEKIAESAVEIPLASNATFIGQYMEQMLFPEV